MSEWQPHKPTIEQIRTNQHWQRRMKEDENGIVIDFRVIIEDGSVRYSDKNNEWFHSVEFWADDTNGYWSRDVYRPRPEVVVPRVDSLRKTWPKLRDDIHLLAKAIWPDEGGIFEVTVRESVVDATRQYAQFRLGPYEISVIGDPDESMDKVTMRIWDLLKDRATRRINELQHAVRLR